MSAPLHIFTAAAANYLPKVRVLFDSIREHHPDAQLHLALGERETLAQEIRATGEFGTVHTPESLGLADWQGWAFCHDVVELCTAIKAPTLKALLALPGAEHVIFLDPDTVVYSALTDVLDSLKGDASIALTPHQTQPDDALEAVIDHEICCLRNGVYNLGFIAVRADSEGKRFAAWWSDRLYHFCRVDVMRGLFTDQRWIDLVPALFDRVAMVRSPRHNVAPWNLSQREFGRADGRYTVDGQPLGFYHFTGFDSDAHLVMAYKHRPTNAALEQLFAEYAAAVAKAEHRYPKREWSFARFSDGTSVPRNARIAFRERADLQARWPDPFDASDPSSCAAWWATEGAGLYGEMHAEYPASHFPQLTAGYRVRQALQDKPVGTTLHRLKVGVLNASTRRYYWRRGVEVLRSAGVRGVMRKLAGR